MRNTTVTRPDLEIIYPVYYEENNIEKVLRGVDQHTRTDYIVTIVYQDDNDPTIPIVRRMMRKKRNINLLKSKYGIGIMPALKTGFEHAKGRLILIMMADLSDDPREIEKMVHMILKEGYDLVCASRYSPGGRRLGGSALKGFLSFFACKTLRLFTGIPTYDVTNAFKCFRRSMLREITIESTKGFELPLEITVKWFLLGKKIGEVPTVWKERTSGESKFKLFQEIPYYLRWYTFAIKKRWIG